MIILVNWVLMILGVFGIIELTGMITIWLRRPKNPPQCLTVVPLKGKIENPEQLILYIREVAQWSPESQRAILVDLGLEAESKKMCEVFCTTDSRVEFYTKQQLNIMYK